MTWRRRNDHCWVYFIESADPVGHIKIGCSRSPMNRLAALRGWSPFPLTVLAKIDGDEALERRFHALFVEDRVQGEWFLRTDAVMAVVESIKAGTFDVSSLPSAVDIRQRTPRGDGLGRIAASMTARLTGLAKRGTTPPPHIAEAAVRFSNNPYRVGWDRVRDLSDAATVQAWLADHSPLPANIAAELSERIAANDDPQSKAEAA